MSNQWEYDYSELYNSARRGQTQTPPQTPPIINAAYTEQPNYAPPLQSQPPQPPHTEKHRKGLGKRIATGAVAVVLCGAVGFGGGYLGSVVAGRGMQNQVSFQQPAATDGNTASAGTPSTTADTMNVSSIVTKASPSVVEVSTEQATTNAWFQQYVTSGAGSGVIISEDGYIVTNNHVVSGASQIRVTLHDKQEYTATLIGTDSKTDIAVLKIDATGLPAATLGNSDNLVVGEFALAVGNPLGSLGGTVTDGIISALDREVNVQGQSMRLLQTNAAVSPGNSGGGLFNGNGELIGIVNAKSSASNTEGLGFAIPINTAIQVAQELINNGYVTGRPALGVTVLSVSDLQTAMQYGVNRLGVYITELVENGAAQKAGLQVGDMFVSVGETAISSSSDVTDALDSYQVGDSVDIQVIRDNKILTVSLVLQEKSAPAATPTEKN